MPFKKPQTETKKTNDKNFKHVVLFQGYVFKNLTKDEVKQYFAEE